MTVLLGIKFADGVVFTADTKVSGISNDGTHIGEYSKSKKIIQLKSNMLIATAGLTLASKTANLLRITLLTENDFSKESTIELCKEYFQFTFNKFMQVNPQIKYTDGVALIGGYDKDRSESFLYELSSTNSFEPIHQGNLVAYTPTVEIKQQLTDYITKHFHRIQTSYDIPLLFSEAIRLVEHESVGKETYSYLLFCNQEGVFKELKVVHDEEGNIID